MKPYPNIKRETDQAVRPNRGRLLNGWDTICLVKLHFFRQGLLVSALCLAIAWALWALRPGDSFWTRLAYSISIGWVSFLLIGGGRYFIDQDSPHNFPRGLKGLSLICFGVIAGYLVGSFLAATLLGHSRFGLVSRLADQPVAVTMLSLAAGAGISFYFYLQGKSAYLQSEIEKQQHLSTDAQLRLLQSQLDSHMLFNTLANLRILIHEDPQRAMQMVDLLGNFLRNTLGATRANEHSLQAEFDRLRDYLTLMQVRMGSRLTFALRMAPELTKVQVPTLILQSIVENAIVHGLEPKVGGGSVEISATAFGSRLVLEVRDNGLGYNGENTPLSGFGLQQVRARLANRYGSLASIEWLAPEANCANGVGGCCVRISMPLETPPAIA